MRILIVGGSGFIGKHLVKRACILKWKVFTISRRKQKKHSHPKNVKNLHIDLSNYKEAIKIKKFKFDYVINAGGYVNHESFFDNGPNVISNQFFSLVNLCFVLKEMNIKKMIHLGSSEELNSLNLKKNTSSSQINFSTPYSFSKKISSEFLQMLFSKESFPVTVLRLFLVYGPGQKNNRLIPFVIENCLKNKKFNVTSGIQKRDFCYIDDVVDAIFKCLLSKTTNGKIYDLGSSEAVTIKSVINKIRVMIGKGNPRFGKKKKERNEINYLVANIINLKKDINWSPKINLKEGILKTIKYYE